MSFRPALPPWTWLDVVRGITLAIVLSVIAEFALVGLVSATGQGSGVLTKTLFLGLPVGMVVLALLEGVFALSAWWYSVRKYGVSRQVLGFVQPRGRAPYLLAVGAWVFAVVLIALWGRLIEILGWHSLKVGSNAGEVIGLGGSFVVALLVVAAWGPFNEELFFRGFGLAGLRNRLGDRGALVVSAALFALFHLDPTQYVPIFIFGMVLGWLYLRTGSIWPCILAHSLQNAVALLVASGVR